MRAPAEQPHEPGERTEQTPQAAQPRAPRPDDLRFMAEREMLKMVMQQPVLLAVGYRQVDGRSFLADAYRLVHEAVVAAGGPASAVGTGAGPWVAAVTAQLPAGPLRSLVGELAVEAVTTRAEADARYAGAILAKLAERVAAAQELQIRSELQRAEATGDHDRGHLLAADLMKVSAYRRALADRANGGS